MKRILSFTLALMLLLAVGCSTSGTARPAAEGGDLFDAIAENRPVATVAETKAEKEPVVADDVSTNSSEGATAEEEAVSKQDEWTQDVAEEEKGPVPDIEWTVHTFETTDANGYRLRVTMKMTPFALTSAHADYLQNAWSQVSSRGDLSLSYGEYGYPEGWSDLWLSVGKITIENVTGGWDITSASPVQLHLEYTLVGAMKLYIGQHSGTEFTFKLTSNRSSSSIILCCPELFAPQYPNGQQRTITLEKGKYALSLNYASSKPFPIPVLDN